MNFFVKKIDYNSKMGKLNFLNSAWIFIVLIKLDSLFFDKKKKIFLFNI